MLPEPRGSVSAQSSSAIQNLGTVVWISVSGSSWMTSVAGSSCLSCLTSMESSSWAGPLEGSAGAVGMLTVSWSGAELPFPPGAEPSSCTGVAIEARLVALPSRWLTSEYLAITSSCSTGINRLGGFQSNRLRRWLPLREAHRTEPMTFKPGRIDGVRKSDRSACNNRGSPLIGKVVPLVKQSDMSVFAALFVARMATSFIRKGGAEP